MASNGGFNFHIDLPGLDTFVDELGIMPEDLINNAEAGVVEYGMLLEEGSRELAPFDGGDLMNSIQFQGIKKNNGLIEGSVGSELAYALRRHEDPHKPGTRDKYDNGVKFVRYYLNGKGRRTLRKPAWRGQRAGRKYIERASVATEDDWGDIMGEVVDKTLRGRE